jgi:hypothetical protein
MTDYDYFKNAWDKEVMMRERERERESMSSRRATRDQHLIR